MPTLYYSPGACSLSPHIALLESGLKFETDKVDLKNKKTAKGEDYLKINPNGYVPALRLDSGEVITEGPAIIQYVADQVPDKQLAPAASSAQRYKLYSVLNFITAELHKSIGVLFSPAPDAYKETVKARLTKRFEYVESVLSKQAYILGEQFSVADGYLFWNARSWQHLGGVLPPAVKAWHDKIAAREAVKAALAGET